MRPDAGDEGADSGPRRVAIDDGMRRWYQSCPCCLSEAYPEVKQRLDEETKSSPMAAAGPAPGVS